MRRTVRRAQRGIWAVLLLGFLAGCGGDGITSNEGPGFPSISNAILSQWCVRGTIRQGGSRTGGLENTDCNTDQSVGVFAVRVGLGTAFFEAWRLRVDETMTVRISTSSNLDTVLDVYRIPDLADPTSAVFLQVDDDDGQELNAQLDIALSPDTEYWVFVSGFDPSETGFYTLAVN